MFEEGNRRISCSTEEAAKMLHTTPDEVRHLASQGKLLTFLWRGRRRFFVSQLQKLASHPAWSRGRPAA